MTGSKEAEWDARARRSLADGGRAFERLLFMAEKNVDTGQASVVASFISSVVGFSKFDLYDLRNLDVDISDDVMVCIDTIRWRKAHLADLVPSGWLRAHAICNDRGFAPESAA